MLVRTDPGSNPRFRPPFGHGLGQPPGPDMVLSQPLDHGGHGDEARGGEDPRLAHPPSKAAALDPGGPDRIVGSRQEGADRGAQSLGEAAHHGGRHPRLVGHGDAGRHFGVP